MAEGHPPPPLCVFERWLCESKNDSLERVMWRGALGQGKSLRESWVNWGVCMVDLVTHDTGNWPWARRERSFAQIPSIPILYVMLFFSAEPYIWCDIYKSWDEFAATKLLRKLLRLGCFWCSESRRKLRKSGVSEVGSSPVGDTTTLYWITFPGILRNKSTTQSTNFIW